MARTSPRKRTVVDYTEKDEKPITTNGAKSAAATTIARKVNGGTSESSKKRKVEEPDSEEVVSRPAAPKKRKTKGKDEDSMPLAERTAVTSLKKAMYIGAHVSAAGG